MAFKRTITFVAIILLVAIFIFMIFFMGRKNADVIYPPVLNKCPDYWDYNEDNGSKKCMNTFGMKKNTNDANDIPPLDLDNYSQGTVGKCGKRDWAIDNGLTWDGITNNEKLDCSEY